MVCAVVGGCNAHYDSMCVCICVYVCYRVSRWVYVIRAVQADAELMLSVGGAARWDAEKHLCSKAHDNFPVYAINQGSLLFHLSTEGQRSALSFHKINHLMLLIHIYPVQAV